LIMLGGLNPVRNIQDMTLIATRLKLSGMHLHSLQRCFMHVVRNETNWARKLRFMLLFTFKYLTCDVISVRSPQAEIVPVKLSLLSL
jgi:hypothetical protein